MTAPELAQVAADSLQPYAREGIVGAMFLWLTLRVEKKFDKLEHTIKGLSMGILMDLSSRKVLVPAAQKMVDDMLKKMGCDPAI